MTAGSPRLFPVAQEQLTSDDYYTPAWVFERMAITFDLDVCAPPGGVLWIPAARFYTQTEDGLASEWSGRVWMNPPWSNTTPWTQKFIAHRNGVALVPASKGLWFTELWGAADAVVVPERATFMFRGEVKSTFFAVVLMAFGDECVEAISRLGVVRRIA